MGKHTAGPWIIRDGDEWTHDVVTHHGGLPDGAPNAWNVASINGLRDEAKSNLALIAAAPDLLEALELILEARTQEKHMWKAKPGESPLHDRCRAAIAKAKGEHP